MPLHHKQVFRDPSSRNAKAIALAFNDTNVLKDKSKEAPKEEGNSAWPKDGNSAPVEAQTAAASSSPAAVGALLSADT